MATAGVLLLTEGAGPGPCVERSERKRAFLARGPHEVSRGTPHTHLGGGGILFKGLALIIKGGYRNKP